MKEQGAQLIYNGSTLLDIALMGKQRYEMGYMIPMAYGSDNEIATLKSIAGINGIQGLIGNQCAPWELEKTKVAPRYLEMANKIRENYQEIRGKPLPHAGSFTIGINQVGQYIEVCQLAGSTDPDKVMATFRSNVIDTFIGSYKLTGIKTFGMNISFGYPCAMAEIRGEQSIHIGEYPLTDVDIWYDELSKYK